MSIFDHSLSASQSFAIGNEKASIIEVSDFFEDPDLVVADAAKQNYAHINPHYPGVRAAIDQTMLAMLCDTISDMTATQRGQEKREWEGQAWYSIVTRPAQALAPIQRLPHFDGFDEAQMAVMIYLNQTDHGGTAFYRHRSTGFEHVTEARYPEYKARLEQDMQKTGLPPAAYITDGVPHFDKIFESSAAFNSLIIYPGTLLHSGVIRNDLPLSADPKVGRLTINGFFRPR